MGCPRHCLCIRQSIIRTTCTAGAALLARESLCFALHGQRIHFYARCYVHFMNMIIVIEAWAVCMRTSTCRLLSAKEHITQTSRDAFTGILTQVEVRDDDSHHESNRHHQHRSTKQHTWKGNQHQSYVLHRPCIASNKHNVLASAVISNY